MTERFNLAVRESAPGTTTAVRDHYQRLAEELLRSIWTERRLVGICVGAALVLGFGILSYIGTSYTAQAIVTLTFSRQEPAAAAVRTAPIAAMEASAVVDSAARMMRSRPLAAAVVARLGLDSAPASPSLFGRLLSRAKAAVGIRDYEASSREAAVSRLLGQVRISSELRSYLITVSATDRNADRAVELANAVAAEYLRAEALAQTSESYATAEREAAELSTVYGPRHPTYAEAHAKLQRLQRQIRDLREAPSDSSTVRALIGQSLLPAQNVTTIPSSPQPLLVFAVAAVLGGAVGVGIVVGRQRLWPKAWATRSGGHRTNPVS